MLHKALEYIDLKIRPTGLIPSAPVRPPSATNTTDNLFHSQVAIFFIYKSAANGQSISLMGSKNHRLDTSVAAFDDALPARHPIIIIAAREATF